MYKLEFDLNIMIKLNKQSSLVLVAVIFATAMIVGSIAASDNMAFATYKKVTKQVRSQSNANAQSTSCAANGGAATGTGSGLLAGIGFANSTNTGINACFNTNTNNAGDQSDHCVWSITGRLRHTLQASLLDLADLIAD